MYYKKAAIVLHVYSTTDYESFDDLVKWHQEIENNGEASSHKIVVGTKIDDTEADESEMVPKQVALQYAQSINAQFFLTSSKENIGIDKLFKSCAEICARNTDLRNDTDVSS